MQPFDLADRDSPADLVRLPDGQAMTIRLAGVADAAALQAYFRGLSPMSRYNRLMGAASELPAGELDRFIHPGLAGGYTVVATVKRDGRAMIIGEARYVVDAATGTVEIGLSVHDAMQRRGVGTALLANLECRAATDGALALLGDTLRSNGAMLALARKAGFTFAATPGDWKQMRFEKAVAVVPATMTCASRRLAAPAAA